MLVVTAVIHRDPVDMTLSLLPDPDIALVLALLAERLSRATSGQHRVLAAQIRSAAKLIADTGGDTPRTTSAEGDS